jgi:hypothetical protein
MIYKHLFIYLSPALYNLNNGSILKWLLKQQIILGSETKIHKIKW